MTALAVMQETASVAISLETGCQASASCDEFADGLFGQLKHGYDVCSVLPIPATLDEWRCEHRTARKRAARCSRRCYRFAEIPRHLHTDDVFEINRSAPVRQGRPMAPGYLERPRLSTLPEYRCGRHRVATYGVLDQAGVLRAYLWLYRAGDLALVSSILGHADHLENEVMYLLFEGVVRSEAGTPGFLVYNRHDSGTDGLRFFKDRLGFIATHVEWLT